MNFMGIKQQSDGSFVKGVAATIPEVKNYRSGVAASGKEWSLQGLVLADSEGGTMRATWWSPHTTDIAQLQGKSVYINSAKVKKGSFTADNGNTYPTCELQINGNDLILQDGTQPAPEPPQEYPQAVPAPAPQAVVPVATAPVVTTGKITDLQMVTKIQQLSELLGKTFPNDQARQAAIATIIITSQKGQCELTPPPVEEDNEIPF